MLTMIRGSDGATTIIIKYASKGGPYAKLFIGFNPGPFRRVFPGERLPRKGSIRRISGLEYLPDVEPTDDKWVTVVTRNEMRLFCNAGDIAIWCVPGRQAHLVKCVFGWWCSTDIDPVTGACWSGFRKAIYFKRLFPGKRLPAPGSKQVIRGLSIVKGA
ncbi:MAG: hypothetical protein M0R06_15325 [Sphaerochaeta sp.]|jgi:hypothetical protein|nr:hypothetical protein [Sphaerochaeta sp.]